VDFLQHKKLVSDNRARLGLPEDCTEALEPEYQFTTRYFWTFRWVFTFRDRKYLQLREHYTKKAGLMHSERSLMAFHYGAIVSEGADGLPTYRPDDPVDIRIDNVHGTGAHLHYGTPQPHHYQESVKDLDLAGLEMITFIKAIFRHRKSSRPIHDVLHFRLRPPEAAAPAPAAAPEAAAAAPEVQRPPET
jgi:hypothetical protein